MVSRSTTRQGSLSLPASRRVFRNSRMRSVICAIPSQHGHDGPVCVSFEVQTVVRVGERTNRVTSSLTQALPWIGGATLRTAGGKDEQASSEIKRRRWRPVDTRKARSSLLQDASPAESRLCWFASSCRSENLERFAF